MTRLDRSEESYRADGERLTRAAAADDYRPPDNLSDNVWQRLSEGKQGVLLTACGVTGLVRFRWLAVVLTGGLALLAAALGWHGLR